MGNLVPDQPLIYERANGVVFARYRDPPHNKIPRWIIGGDLEELDRLQNKLSYNEFIEMANCAKTNYTLKKQLDKALIIWYTIRDETD